MEQQFLTTREACRRRNNQGKESGVLAVVVGRATSYFPRVVGEFQWHSVPSSGGVLLRPQSNLIK